LSIEKLKDPILHVHAADNDGLTNQHMDPGEGTIDWEAVFNALQKHHFKG
jgi:sugar phosphate isomerase/epimerase